MQVIVGVIEHLDMVATADKYIVARLMEAVESLTRNNVSLMTQFRDTMKNNVDMAKKLNINPTQDPELKKLADKAKRKAEFKKNLDPDVYCWTHRFWVTKRHSSHTCCVPAAGHQRVATRKISWGAERPGNDTMG